MVRTRFNQIFQKKAEGKIQQNHLQLSCSFGIQVKPNNSSTAAIPIEYVPDFMQKYCPGEFNSMIRDALAASSKMFRFVDWHDLIIMKLKSKPCRMFWNAWQLLKLKDTLTEAQKISSIFLEQQLSVQTASRLQVLGMQEYKNSEEL